MDNPAHAILAEYVYAVERPDGTAPGGTRFREIPRSSAQFEIASAVHQRQKFQTDPDERHLQLGAQETRGTINSDLTLNASLDFLAGLLSNRWRVFQGNMWSLTPGTVDHVFRIKRAWHDVGNYQQFPHCRVDRFTLSVAPSAAPKASFTFTGQWGSEIKETAIGPPYNAITKLKSTTTRLTLRNEKDGKGTDYGIMEFSDQNAGNGLPWAGDRVMIIRGTGRAQNNGLRDVTYRNGNTVHTAQPFAPVTDATGWEIDILRPKEQDDWNEKVPWSPSDTALTTYEGRVLIDDREVATVTSIEITVDNQYRRVEALGYQSTSRVLRAGPRRVSGSMTLVYEHGHTHRMANKYLLEQRMKLELRLLSGSQQLVVVLDHMRLTQAGTATEGFPGLPVNMTFTALAPDPANSPIGFYAVSNYDLADMETN